MLYALPEGFYPRAFIGYTKGDSSVQAPIDGLEIIGNAIADLGIVRVKPTPRSEAADVR